MAPFSWKSVHWPNSFFLVGTLLVALTAVPVYLGQAGLDVFQLALFVVFYLATGLSITLGYHRLFTHKSFQASWPVRLATLLFGAAAFESSLLVWASDHRKHHKFVDQEEDPYDITQGFFHAHVGWLLYNLREAPMDNVQDLRKDPLVAWQHRHYLKIAFFMCFGLPTLIGGIWGGATGALGGFLIAGVARVVLVQHMTFFINSFCHTIGRQPYTTQNTARDSGLMALFTFGEGYHNFHHQFQHDYRNGVKAWHFDPTKWCIWLLHKMGLVRELRRVPTEKILMAVITEQHRRLATKMSAEAIALPDSVHQLLHSAQERLHQAFSHWEARKTEYLHAVEEQVEASRRRVKELQRDVREAAAHFREAIEEWTKAYQLVQIQAI